MSKLDEIIDNTREDAVFWRDGVAGKVSDYGPYQAKQDIKDLIQKLVDESFDADDTNAYAFWQKIERL